MSNKIQLEVEQRCICEKEVSEMTGISISKLQKARFNRRGLVYSKIGRSVRYSYEDVIAYMEEARITFS